MICKNIHKSNKLKIYYEIDKDNLLKIIIMNFLLPSCIVVYKLEAYSVCVNSFQVDI